MKKVLDAKTRIFQHLGAVPRCKNTPVAADLLDDHSLAKGLEAAGFDQSLPAVFLAEGLIMYLKEGVSWKGQVEETIDIGQSFMITCSCRFGFCGFTGSCCRSITGL